MTPIKQAIQKVEERISENLGVYQGSPKDTEKINNAIFKESVAILQILKDLDK